MFTWPGHVGAGMWPTPPPARPRPPQSPREDFGFRGRKFSGRVGLGFAMEPVASWGPGSVVAWLRGLDDLVQEYPFEEWALVGSDLLQLSPQSLEALGVWHIGHQELILDGVEQLRTLSSGLETENLRKLTEQLQTLTHKLCSLVPGCLGASGEPAPDLLTGAIELVRAAWALLCWLNRYLFSQINDFSACQEIGDLCRELAQALQEDYPVVKKEAKILRLGDNILSICDTILNFSPTDLLDQLAVLELVELRGRHPEESLGLEILTTSSCHHFVSGTVPESPADCCSQILLGDEIVQVNGQVVVGWPRASLNRQLLQDPALLSLVLKTVPVPKPAPQSPLDISSSRSQSPGLASPSPRASEDKAFVFDQSPDARFPSSSEAGPTTPLACGNIWCSDGTPSSPGATDLHPAAQPGTEETESHGSPEPLDKSPSCTRKKSRSKGVATRLSRRRVSCRELGRPDCDGWLLLRKVPGGFMGPRWRRCWMVLKGHNLYWYRQPQDEKAEGLINVSNYSLESGRDQKKKYVFQLTHDMYKPFIFAADTLADLSMWVSHLVTCISKYQSHSRTAAHREEDCYSETEAEDPDEEVGSRSTSPSPVGVWSFPPGDASPSATTPQGSPQVSHSPSTASDSSSEGALEHLVRGLQQGGVSLLGRPQFLTQEQCRRSFLRRARDPQLNERAHHVRCLQSTLKAKLQELQVLDEVLNDPMLTSEKFQRWKEKNQELYSDRPGTGTEGTSCLPTLEPENDTASDSKEHLPPDTQCSRPPDL